MKKPESYKIEVSLRVEPELVILLLEGEHGLNQIDLQEILEYISFVMATKNNYNVKVSKSRQTKYPERGVENDC